MYQNRAEKQSKKLIADSHRIVAEIEAHAKSLGIDTKNMQFKDYYRILGISSKSSQIQIREAYIKSIKKSHPDVNKSENAHAISERLNEAYSTLKDRNLREDYDRKFVDGSVKLNPSATSFMINRFMSRYNALRNKDIQDFNMRSASARTRDSYLSLIEEFIDWKGRFNQVNSEIFGKLYDDLSSIKRLKKFNESLLKTKNIHNDLQLAENLYLLSNTEKKYDSVVKDIKKISRSIETKIAENENIMSSKIRYGL